MNKSLFILFSTLFFTLSLKAQSHKSTVDSLPILFLNWQNEAPDNTKIPGVATEKAYLELLLNKSATKKIIVAVIDSGVDIEHEDLLGKIWQNEDEIAGNGIDDDGNGYIDDVNGWNFLGNTNGEMANKESLELTRIIRDYRKEFAGKELKDVAENRKDIFLMYQKAVLKHQEETEKYTKIKKENEKYYNEYVFSEKLLKTALRKEKFTIDELKAFSPNSNDLSKAKAIVIIFRENGIDVALKELLEQMNDLLQYNLNIEYNGRLVVGDNPNDLNDRNYGNNNVKGDEADHGTFVSSMIGASRNNGIGINGIASHVEIMPIRAVPKGDEYDKDIALAIRYAVDNGANIINMSFGKEFSVHKDWVDDAMQYAAENNVLLIHAAGNDSKNNDLEPSFPNDITLNGQMIETWLEVGANSKENNKKLCGDFSNYGQTTVDVFAPGVDVMGCLPNNKYDVLNGTSFSCPVTSGVAALVWAYYPNLTALQLKSIIIESSYDFGKSKVIIPGEEKKKTRFKYLSVSGGIVNAYDALLLAEEMTK